MLGQAEATAKELNSLVDRLDQGLSAPAIDRRIDALADATDQRIDRVEGSTRSLISQLSWNIGALILLSTACIAGLMLFRRLWPAAKS
jgi:hypothetical protein